MSTILHTAARTLTLTPEDAFAEVEAFVSAPTQTGERRVLRPATGVPPAELERWSVGRAGGPATAPWRSGAAGATLGETVVCRVAQAWAAPGFGAVVADDGRVFGATVGELLPYRSGLAELPGVAVEAGGHRFLPPPDALRLPAATLFQGWGGGFNYGHFLLDSLPALLAAEQAGVLGEAPPLAPPQSRRGRELLALAFPAVVVRETPAPWVRLDAAVFSTAMDHYLHRPSDLTLGVRDRLLAATPTAGGSPLKLYLSRLGLSGRILVNEATLERHLRSRGFTIVHPERLSAAEQIALLRRAEVVVGASGAAMANALFAPPGARVVELLPEGFAWPWLRDLCRVGGLDWRGWFEHAPVDPRQAPWLSRVRRGFWFAWRLDLTEFLQWLDAG